MADQYRNFAALALGEAGKKSWQIVTIDRRDSDVLIIAPHGGGIERGSSELAAMIASKDYSHHRFEGLKRIGNRSLHITSTHFDEPSALALARRSGIVVGIHGRSGLNRIDVGGRDTELVTLIVDTLVAAGLPATVNGGFPAQDRRNICNRGRRRRGAQLEITADLRAAPFRRQIARLVRTAILAHKEALAC